jgi:hypothetical protein
VFCVVSEDVIEGAAAPTDVTVPPSLILSNLSVLPDAPPVKTKVKVTLPVRLNEVFAKFVGAVVVKLPVREGVGETLVDPPVPEIVTVNAFGPVAEPRLSNPIVVGLNEKPLATVKVQVIL